MKTLQCSTILRHMDRKTLKKWCRTAIKMFWPIFMPYWLLWTIYTRSYISSISSPAARFLLVHCCGLLVVLWRLCWCEMWDVDVIFKHRGFGFSWRNLCRKAVAPQRLREGSDVSRWSIRSNADGQSTATFNRSLRMRFRLRGRITTWNKSSRSIFFCVGIFLAPPCRFHRYLQLFYWHRVLEKLSRPFVRPF